MLAIIWKVIECHPHHSSASLLSTINNAPISLLRLKTIALVPDLLPTVMKVAVCLSQCKVSPVIGSTKNLLQSLFHPLASSRIATTAGSINVTIPCTTISPSKRAMIKSRPDLNTLACLKSTEHHQSYQYLPDLKNHQKIHRLKRFNLISNI